MKSAHKKVITRIAIGMVPVCLGLLILREAIGTTTIRHTDRIQTAEVLPQPVRTIALDNGVDYAVVTGGFRIFYFVAGSMSGAELDAFCSRMGMRMMHTNFDPSHFDRKVIDAGLDLNVFGFQCQKDYFVYTGCPPGDPQMYYELYFCEETRRVVLRIFQSSEKI